MRNRREGEWAREGLHLAAGLLFIALATGTGWLFRKWGFPETNVVVVYILSVVLAARYTRGYWYGIGTSVLATLSYNYFFTEPYYTFTVNDPTYLITFAVMSVTSVITSALTSKVKQNALDAREKEAEASALFRLTNHLTDAQDIPDIANIAVRTISEVLGCRAACLCFGEDGEPEGSFVQQRGPGEQVRREVADGAALKHRIESLRTAFDAGPEFHDWPIYGREAVLGVMRIPSATAEKMNAAQLRLLRSMIESTALAMDRYRSAQEQRRSREDILQERYRANLLRAISHDLRTPLASIMGTGEMLMGTLEPGDQRYRLAAEIYKDAGWLHSLVENILSLTRLRDGKIVLNKQTEAVEEVIGVAVNAIGKRAPGHEISVAAPEEVLLVPMDAKLIEQVLVNLLDNSVKHTPPGKEIKVSVREDREKGTAVFTVANRGPGIDPADLPRIFETFYTTRGKEPDARRGVGLGLAICETIVRAHGGTIAARAGEGGEGAEFVFTLPLEDKAHD